MKGYKLRADWKWRVASAVSPTLVVVFWVAVCAIVMVYSINHIPFEQEEDFATFSILVLLVCTVSAAITLHAPDLLRLLLESLKEFWNSMCLSIENMLYNVRDYLFEPIEYKKKK